ncbi:hypothetical protein QWY85_02295 [Neolewinella lacunae]|uniref:Outer membrane protein beta-barrel domain-containing protein n=1 Tax=Neolewinella lacunae TaxID=1517758 RepID=A0A923TCD2_9BACT|nr:hypothetical protein [Neolewinella lacunae]MBC6993597.1 hypothetical protein [Neolewinella lacunae]MDN3633471.1 hypothetical protein [Neolewinella lacunae]
MITNNERGSLGKRFDDLPTPGDFPELSWEKMAPKVLRPTPEEEPRRKFFAWWWLALGALLLAFVGGLVYWTTLEQDGMAAGPVAEGTLPNYPASDLDCPAATVRETGLAGGENTLLAPALASQEANSSGTKRVATDARQPAPSTPTASRVSTTSPVGQTLITEPVFPPPRPDLHSLRPLENGPIAALPVAGPGIDREVRLPISAAAPEGKRQDRERTLSLLAGPLTYGLGYEQLLRTDESQLSAQLRLGYTQSLNERWFLATGLDLRHYRFRTAFVEVDDNARFFRPGTVDTIFRNLTTGEERIVTTDTVGGTRIRRFGNDNVVTTLGVPVLLGRSWTAGVHHLSLAAGPRIDFLLGREGRTVVNNLEVIDLATAPQFGQNIRWAGRLEAGYDWQPQGRWSVALRLGTEAAFRDWSVNGSSQKPRSLDGLIGLRYRW